MASAKQRAARALFARRARSGAFRRAGRRVRTRLSRRRSLGGGGIVARRRSRRIAHRIRHRFSRMRRPHKQSMISKGINVAALLIGVSPVISIAKTRLLDQQGNFEGFSSDITDIYTAGVGTTGQFSIQKAALAYGPIAGAILFKKGISLLRRHVKF